MQINQKERHEQTTDASKDINEYVNKYSRTQGAKQVHF